MGCSAAHHELSAIRLQSEWPGELQIAFSEQPQLLVHSADGLLPRRASLWICGVEQNLFSGLQKSGEPLPLSRFIGSPSNGDSRADNCTQTIQIVSGPVLDTGVIQSELRERRLQVEIVRGLHRAKVGVGVPGTGAATWVQAEPVDDANPTDRAKELAREYRAVIENVLEYRVVVERTRRETSRL